MAFFARFTERAQRALLAAQKEAASMRRNYVGTEHLLLGIMRDPGKAGVILNAVSLDEVRAVILQMVGEGDENVNTKTMSYAPRTKKVLEQSAKEARALKQNYVGTEHLLLALMFEREGVAAQALMRLGMNLTKAREDLLRACGLPVAMGNANARVKAAAAAVVADCDHEGAAEAIRRFMLRDVAADGGSFGLNRGP